LAVLRLITSSYLTGACTGRYAGFSPLLHRWWKFRVHQRPDQGLARH
jgi:hypothetical protein